jgi:hypothetical protein
MPGRLAELDKRATVLLREFHDISRLERHGENWLLFTSVLSKVYAALGRIALENGLV